MFDYFIFNLNNIYILIKRKVLKLMKVKYDFYIGYRDTNSKRELTNTALLAYLENVGGIHSRFANDNITGEHTWILIGWKVKLYSRNDIACTICICISIYKFTIWI